MEEQKRVPKLRFKEFSGRWETKKLGEISTNIMYGIGAAATNFDGINKYLRITDIDVVSRTFKANPITSPEGKIGKKYFLRENDIVFARTGASVGKSYLYNEGDGILVFAGFLIKVHIVSENANFVFQHTLRKNYQKWVETMSMRSGQPGLNAEEYKTLRLNFPSLPEQQKIASFLSAVDKKITQLQQKKSLLEQYKKGVMQQLFSQKLRFTREDGSAYPDWEEQKMKDVAPLQRGFDLPTSKIIEGDYPVVYSNGILRKHKEFKVNAPGVITGRSGTIGQVTYINEKFWPHNTSLWVTDFKGNYPKFIYYLYHFFKLERFNAGSTVPTLNRNDVHAVKKHIPIRPEQTQIAHFLSAIDKKIAVVETQTEQTQQFKKGLLQQMFV